MKTLSLLALLLLGSLVGRADELLLNEDFSNGAVSWDGDGRAAGDSDSINLSDPGVSTGGGLVVQLDPGHWTKVSQRFEPRDPTVTLKVIYTVAPGTTFAKLRSNHFDLSTKLGFIRSKPIQFPNRNWVVIVFNVAGGNWKYFKVAPNFDSTAAQYVSGHVAGMVAHEEEAICLGFPPGQGSITLHYVGLSNP
jgi:hypothetical protein